MSPWRPVRMTRDNASKAAALHVRSPHITGASLAYEHYDNPDGFGGLFFGEDEGGEVVATQAFVAYSLIRDGRRLETLRGERTLLADRLRGQAVFKDFFLATLDQICTARTAYLWTSTVVDFSTYGFESAPYLASSTLAFNLRPAAKALTGKGALKHRLREALRLGALALRFRRSGTDARVGTPPTPGELAAFLAAVSRANPQTAFLAYSPEKLDWITTRGRFRDRSAVFIRSGEALTSMAIVEPRPDAVFELVDFLTVDPKAAAGDLAALIGHLGDRGGGGLRYWGNFKNPYVAAVFEAFSRLGASRLKTGKTQLLTRTPAGISRRCVEFEELAMTQAWLSPI